jgi:hypothetical protein
MVHKTPKRHSWTWKTAPLLMVLLVPAALCACSSNGDHDGTTETDSTKSSVVVFSDRSDARKEYLFAFDGRRVFAQSHDFPGFADKKTYGLDSLRGPLADACRLWAGRKGDVQPPFVSPGPLFAVVRFPTAGAGSPTMEWYSDGNVECRKFLSSLREEVVKEPQRQEKLPSWISDYARIMPYFGYFK